MSIYLINGITFVNDKKIFLNLLEDFTVETRNLLVEIHLLYILREFWCDYVEINFINCNYTYSNEKNVLFLKKNNKDVKIYFEQ